MHASDPASPNFVLLLPFVFWLGFERARKQKVSANKIIGQRIEHSSGKAF